MQTTYNSWLVALSIIVAMTVAYTALKLAARVADSDGKAGRLWLFGGGVSMGVGIWSMHFIGMLAFTVPIPLQYSIPVTLASLLIGMVTSTFALAVASSKKLALSRLSVAAVIMGLGICGMHYSGMAAIRIVPMISYDTRLVLASITIAVVASFAALWLAFNLRSGKSIHISMARLGAAAIMGLAISGMHYTGMASARLAAGAYCIGGRTFNNGWLAVAISLFAFAVLAITLITAIYDAHLTSQARKDAQHLAQANAALEHGKNLLSLATRAAGIFCWEYDLLEQKMLWTENELLVLQRSDHGRTNPEAIIAATHPDDSHVMLAAVHRALRDGKETCTYRVRMVNESGAVAYIEVHAKIVCDDAQRPIRLLAVSWDITEQVLEDARHHSLQLRLREASREAGMAEVATGVLHSVGNVLNSLGVSATLLDNKLRSSRAGNLQRVASMLLEQGEHLGEFFMQDERGKQIPAYLAQLGKHLETEQQSLADEAQAIAEHVRHIRTIVAAQQTHAKRGGVTELVDLAELLDSAIAIYFAGTNDIDIRREYGTVETIMLDRHKVLQILGNLLSNARHALLEVSDLPRIIHVRLRADDKDTLSIQVQDSGIGIDENTLKRLFEFGFTTKKHGHGFGLHSSAILAKELGGELSVSSEGLNRGACFTLRLRREARALARTL